MSIQTNVDLGFPLRLYSLGCEPKPKKNINYHSKTEFLEEVENAVGEEVWNYIRDYSLEVVTRFVDNKFTWSSKIVEHILVNQLTCKEKHEMWCLFGNIPARFSLSEFEDITTLNCAPFRESEDVVDTKAHKKLWKMLKVTRKSPCKRELKGALEDVSSWSSEDKICFTYSSILATFIVGEDDKKELPFAFARMVFYLPKFEKYPWSREAFKRLIESVKHVNLNANSYTLDGFVQALQVWAYNGVPSLGAKIGRPSNVGGPPILKFKGLKGLNNIDIHVVSVTDEKNIKNVVINHVTHIVWGDRVVDEKIDSLLKAICKEGGLRVVTWVEHGSNNIQMGKNKTIDVGGEDAEDKEESDGKRKCRLEVITTGMKKMKAQVSSASCDHDEALNLRIELEQQAKKLETMEAQL